MFRNASVGGISNVYRTVGGAIDEESKKRIIEIETKYGRLEKKDFERNYRCNGHIFGSSGETPSCILDIDINSLYPYSSK